MDQYNITWKDTRSTVVALGILLLWAIAVFHHTPPQVNHKDASTLVTVTWLKETYDQDNTAYFQNKLPSNPRISLDLYNNTELAISYRIEKDRPVIQFNPEYNLTRVQAELTELHEMCHISLPKGEEHGSRWLGCMHRLATEGAMDQLW